MAMKLGACALAFISVVICSLAITPSEAAAGKRATLGRTDYLFSNGHTYTWHEAKDYCKTIGMALVSIETARENALIKDYIDTEGISGSYWTSGTDHGRTNHDFIWDSTGRRVTFTDWGLNEPNNLYGEYYIEYRYVNGVLSWNDLNGNQKFNLICEEVE